MEICPPLSSQKDFLSGRAFLFWGIALALGCLSTTSLAQDPEKKVIAVHINSPIVIDGNLDEPDPNPKNCTKRMLSISQREVL